MQRDESENEVKTETGDGKDQWKKKKRELGSQVDSFLRTLREGKWKE